jgi:hypothetical protein
LRTKSGRRDERGRGANRAPAEAGKTGRGVLLPIAHSLSRGNSSEPSQFERWRDALLGSVAASAVMLYGARPVRAACAGATPTLSCTGTITGTSTSNGGVLANNNGFTTINISALTANIAPTTGAGVSVTNASAISITSDTGTYSIVTANTTNGDGIFATGAGTTAITINSKGNINTTAGRLGIYARRTGAGAVSVTSQGNISSRTSSIVAQSAGGS